MNKDITYNLYYIYYTLDFYEICNIFLYYTSFLIDNCYFQFVVLLKVILLNLLL